MEWNFEQEPHEATDETGVNLRAYFDRMPDEKTQQYSPLLERRASGRMGWQLVTVQVAASIFLDKSRRIVYCKVDECENDSPGNTARSSGE